MKKLITLLGIITIGFISCSKEEVPNKEVTYEYKYEVSGSGGSFDVTFENTDNNTQQYSNVGSGWWYKWTQAVTLDGSTDEILVGTRWLYLSAQNNNSSGDVTVKIYRNNVVVASNTSYGGYVIATVDGSY